MEKVTAYRNLSELEGDDTGVAYYTGADLDQFELKAGQRSISHLFGQFGSLQEDAEIVGQHMKLRPHVVLRYASA